MNHSMGFKWKEFLKVAEELTEQKHSTEAHFRSAISRAYYALYNVLKGEYSVYSKDVSAHQKLITHLKGATNKEEKKLGALLDDLRSKRNQADYEHHDEIKKHNAEYAILMVKKVLKK